jgi:hypothetical protein
MICSIYLSCGHCDRELGRPAVTCPYCNYPTGATPTGATSRPARKQAHALAKTLVGPGRTDYYDLAFDAWCVVMQLRYPEEYNDLTWTDEQEEEAYVAVVKLLEIATRK